MRGNRPIIEVENLSFRFGEEPILDSVSFEVREGEVFVVLGGSGCGKTTLLRCMTGLLRPQSGTVRIDGIDVHQAGGRERAELLRKFGVLFQSGALLKSMTLGENVALPLREKTHLSEEMVAELTRMRLAMVDLDGRQDLMPAEMSGGMQKRGGLARAIALDPRILFFDEPSAGLDPTTSVELDELILGLNRSLGTTMVVVTHELQSIMKIAGRAIMLDGQTHKIIAEGTPAEMRDTHPHPRVQAFFRRQRVAGPGARSKETP
jgi:phospholipid/cholesterol/gamma-HCH transport system ATP-binding protein